MIDVYRAAARPRCGTAGLDIGAAIDVITLVHRPSQQPVCTPHIATTSLTTLINTRHTEYSHGPGQHRHAIGMTTAAATPSLPNTTRRCRSLVNSVHSLIVSQVAPVNESTTPCRQVHRRP